MDVVFKKEYGSFSKGQELKGMDYSTSFRLKRLGIVDFLEAEEKTKKKVTDIPVVAEEVKAEVKPKRAKKSSKKS